MGKLTQIVLTAAMQQQQLIEGQMAAFLAPRSQPREAAGALAGRNLTTSSHGPTQPRSKAGDFLCFAWKQAPGWRIGGQEGQGKNRSAGNRW
jgi:hypothetical protein